MPLFQSKSTTGPVVITKDKDRIIAYTLTPEGVKKLRAAGAAGVRSGQEFPSRAFAALIRSGQAHSPRVADAAGQKQFGFDRSDETDVHLPRCEMTGATSDVHLVVYGEGSGTVTKLLGPEPRFVLQKVTRLSVPVTVLSLATVSQLETAQKVPLKSTAAATLREWFRQDFESAWEKLQKENARKQGVLSLGPDGGELPLDER
jgi:hypothetical protein